MALQLWMPLTKDLRQQGISNIIPTQTTGYTSIAAGKLGGCYKFTGTFDTLLPFSNWNWTEGSVSFGCWAKISRSELATLVNAQTYDSTNSSMGGTLLGRDSYGGLGLRWKTNNIYTDSSLNAVYIYTHIRNTSSAANYTGNYTISFDTWFHIMTVLDRINNKINIYVNGELFTTTDLTVTGTFTTGSFRIAEATWDGGNGRGSAGCWQLNDVRIYDNALSSMEVKQISKGLVLHYPLNRGGWGQNNILLNTGFESRYTQSTGWDTTKNGTQLASSWGGYNSGVPNPSTVYHAHLKQVNGEWVYEYIRTANESWLGIAQGGLQSRLTAGKTYTFSWEEYRVEGNNYPTGGLYYYKTGATSANFHLGQFGGSSGNILGQWRKFSYTFTAPTDGDYSKNMAWYIYGHSGGNGKMYMRHPKLEEGSVATPWCPNLVDALATIMGLNSLIEYDCSGFCNNGIRTGTFSWTSDTPKYSVSTYFEDYTRKLRAPLIFTPTAITMAVWIKSSATGRGSYHMPLNINGAAYEFSIGSDGKFRNGFYINNSRVVDTVNSKNVLDGQWHHLCATYDGTTIKRYVDGISVTGGDHAATGALATTSMLYVGDYGTNETYGNNQIYESDIRIYATALSADDVKSLYQNSAYIDGSGNVYGAVHSEV